MCGRLLDFDMGVLQQLFALIVPLYLHGFPAKEGQLEDCVFPSFDYDRFSELSEVVRVYPWRI